MDNCLIHKGEVIEALIHKAQARLIYLSPYSPDFSPIENCWSKIKSSLRSMAARTYPDLVKAIEAEFDKVSLDHISRLVYPLLILYLSRLGNDIKLNLSLLRVLCGHTKYLA